MMPAEGEVLDPKGLLEEVAGRRTVFSMQVGEEPFLGAGEVHEEVVLLGPSRLVQIP
jgi:hypothetical protein